ncbi:hypothetical protein BFP70_00660 [Thioclava sp. SK-1]|uniref:5-bromo-4-chloroindolyl phosphate hydrolysis family protein n=1 Tax=Thioclava sp. SK-1 TaxID=1889770 RepID=UPI000824DBEF|nr:5-bromo-4-chloroindolyl phosphate hydrolysis family protein [Thioclava sp. SK-1]OCX66704.1 hypothetical protein BFP70_00660 [Thioclava sp. SK-1]
MAKRFGGKFSPNAQTAPRRDATQADIPAERLPRPEHPLEGRPFWIMLCSAPLLLGAFGDGATALALSLISFALVAGGAYTLREGLRAQAEFNARRVARRPVLPRKILGAVLMGCGLAAGAQDPSMGMVGVGLTGVIGTALALLAFGTDPMRDKGMEGIDPFQQDRVARAVEIGEDHLRAMQDAITRANLPRMNSRIEVFATHARDLFRAVEDDPNDLTAARRYMGVYLEGARDATVKFADHWAQTHDPQALTAYDALLTDLEANFTARTRSLIENGREGLEIEIDVLRERLAREGLAPAAQQKDSR